MERIDGDFAVGNALTTLLYATGLALAGYHPQKRALHDLVAGTIVTYRLREGG